MWRQLDSELWELTQNPWVVLQTVSREKLQNLLADPAFRKNVDGLVQARRDASEPFNMAYLAIRGSGAVNGVSRLHGKVSRHLFQPLFPRWPTEEVPVGHVTSV